MPKKPADILPKDQRETITIQLDRIGDEGIKEWLEDELIAARRSGRIPKDWGTSLLLKAMIRGEFQPLRPAPRAAATVENPTPRPKRVRK